MGYILFYIFMILIPVSIFLLCNKENKQMIRPADYLSSLNKFMLYVAFGLIVVSLILNALMIFEILPGMFIIVVAIMILIAFIMGIVVMLIGFSRYYQQKNNN